MPETEIWRRKFKQLAALSDALSTNTTPSQLIETLTEHLSRIIKARSRYYIGSTTDIVKNRRAFKAFFTNKASGDKRLNANFLRSHAIQSLIAVPIPVKKKFAGIIVLANKKGGFTEYDLNLASIVAQHAGSILANIQLRSDEKRRAHQLNLLNELVTEISLMRDHQLLLKTAAERIQRHFAYFRVVAAWADQASHEIRLAHVLLRNAESISKSEIGISDNAVKAVQKGSTIYSRNIIRRKGEPSEVKSIMTSPVKIGESVVAVLEIQSDEPNAFDASDRMVLEAVTSALGSAIQNANAYQNLEKINTQLEETSKLREEILQIVAHDFRSPLTVIRGYMDQLIRKEKWIDLQQKEIMQTVSQQAFRLQKLADATLKASRFDSGDIPFNFEKTDFDSFLRHFVFPWSEKHHFVINTQKDLPIIKGDSGRLQEVMENLLSNAIKYSPEGGDITISLKKVSNKELSTHFEAESEEGTFLLVSVSDQGMGIPEGKKELLFRRFARIHETRRIEGIGLGLYITKKIIEAHGGKIWLQDQKQGACFCFALPEYKSTTAENIVVVEDDTITLRLLHRAISNMGYEVITAWDGKEALDKIFRFQPRLIVTDLMLPELNGEELIRRLRLNQDSASIPIIVFTGKRDYNLEPTFANSVHVVFKHEGVGAIVKLIREILSVESNGDLKGC
jgi:signal transduction histidine kinase